MHSGLNSQLAGTRALWTGLASVSLPLSPHILSPHLSRTGEMQSILLSTSFFQRLRVSWHVCRWGELPLWSDSACGLPRGIWLAEGIKECWTRKPFCLIWEQDPVSVSHKQVGCYCLQVLLLGFPWVDHLENRMLGYVWTTGLILQFLVLCFPLIINTVFLCRRNNTRVWLQSSVNVWSLWISRIQQLLKCNLIFKKN